MRNSVWEVVQGLKSEELNVRDGAGPNLMEGDGVRYSTVLYKLLGDGKDIHQRMIILFLLFNHIFRSPSWSAVGVGQRGL